MKKLISILLVVTVVVSTMSVAMLATSATTYDKITTSDLKAPVVKNKSISTGKITVTLSKEKGFNGIFAVLFKNGKKTAIKDKESSTNKITFSGLSKGQKYRIYFNTLGKIKGKKQYMSAKCSHLDFSAK